MATGDPLLLGKDNDAESVTYLTRKDPERRARTTVLWVQGLDPDSSAIRADGVGGGAAVMAFGYKSGTAVKALAETGIAVMGDASYEGALLLGIGVGGYAQSGVGVWGECADKQTGFAGIFAGNVRVNGDFEVNGVKAAVVPLPDGSMRRVYCMESPENWFEDFGEARLTGGKAEVRIDPNFAALVRGSYHVFLTPYGDSNGLYAGRRTSKAFVVREQGGGKSTLTFSYRIVARRKDVKAPRLPKVTPTPDMKRPPRPDPMEKPEQSGTRDRRSAKK
jgi:hypothetical protein